MVPDLSASVHIACSPPRVRTKAARQRHVKSHPSSTGRSPPQHHPVRWVAGRTEANPALRTGFCRVVIFECIPAGCFTLRARIVPVFGSPVREVESIVHAAGPTLRARLDKVTSELFPQHTPSFENRCSFSPGWCDNRAPLNSSCLWSPAQGSAPTKSWRSLVAAAWVRCTKRGIPGWVASSH
jgi:hypothetical protein